MRFWLLFQDIRCYCPSLYQIRACQWRRNTKFIHDPRYLQLSILMSIDWIRNVLLPIFSGLQILQLLSGWITSVSSLRPAMLPIIKECTVTNIYFLLLWNCTIGTTSIILGKRKDRLCRNSYLIESEASENAHK